MKSKLLLAALVCLNVILSAMLARKWLSRTGATAHEAVSEEAPATSKAAGSSVSGLDLVTRRRLPSPRTPAPVPVLPQTVFTRAYSEDPKTFAANLRAIHCPEETVRDILIAEVTRHNRAKREELFPKPADHVPFAWSANTSERRIMERRQQAATLSREESAALERALGYEVQIQMPVYAMTTREQKFGEDLKPLTPDKRHAAREVQESYWAKVQALQDRTKGFWQPQDMADLDQLKNTRWEALDKIINSQ